MSNTHLLCMQPATVEGQMNIRDFFPPGRASPSSRSRTSFYIVLHFTSNPVQGAEHHFTSCSDLQRSKTALHCAMRHCAVVSFLWRPVTLFAGSVFRHHPVYIFVYFCRESWICCKWQFYTSYWLFDDTSLRLSKVFDWGPYYLTVFHIRPKVMGWSELEYAHCREEGWTSPTKQRDFQRLKRFEVGVD